MTHTPLPPPTARCVAAAHHPHPVTVPHPHPNRPTTTFGRVDRPPWTARRETCTAHDSLLHTYTSGQGLTPHNTPKSIPHWYTRDAQTGEQIAAKSPTLRVTKNVYLLLGFSSVFTNWTMHPVLSEGQCSFFVFSKMREIITVCNTIVECLFAEINECL